MHVPFVQRFTVVFGGGVLLGVVVFLATGGGAFSTPQPTLTTAEWPVESSITSESSMTVEAAPVAPTSAPAHPSSTTPARGRLVIHGTGDVNTDSTYNTALAAEGHPYAWTGVASLFRDDDLTVVNLECTPSDLGEPLPKEYVFRCDQPSLPAMAEAGVDVVNLANNHTRDHGASALLDGLQQARDVGLTPVGVGADAESAARPALFDIDGWTVAVVGLGGVVPSPAWIASSGRPGMADGDTLEAMASAVRAADEVADIVVVSVHWGVELDTEPRPADRRRAEAMVAAGADVILGHHAHRLQPLETMDGATVAWGLGNFVWPAVSEAAATTAVARIVVEPDGEVAACLVPVEITRGRPEPTGDPPC